MPADYNISAWTPKNATREFTTSSGAKCLLRELDMEDLVELDIVDQIDSLTALVQTEHIERVSGKKSKRERERAAIASAEAERKSMLGLMRDKNRFRQITELLDKVVMRCVISPALLDPYIVDPNNVSAENPTGRRKLLPEERDARGHYVDLVPMRDKMGIFGEVFQSMEGLEKFREESEEDLGDLADKPESPEDASGSVGSAE